MRVLLVVIVIALIGWYIWLRADTERRQQLVICSGRPDTARCLMMYGWSERDAYIAEIRSRAP